MDPNAMWERIKQAIRDGEPIAAIDAAIDLGEWLNRGGFKPDNDLTLSQTHCVLGFLYDLDPDDALRNADTD